MFARSSDSSLTQISVQDLAACLVSPPEGLQLIDVREPEEWAIAHLDGFLNLPLSQFAVWSTQLPQQLDATAETIVLCHHGIRSAQMCRWLLQQGFVQVKNVAGGIEAYAAEVDPSVPRY